MDQRLVSSAYANFTYAKNRVDEYDEPASRIGTYRAQTGRSRNELLGLTAERLFLPEDFDADGNLLPGIPRQDGVGGTNLQPGDIKYKDLNGDGAITEEDAGFIGGTNDPRKVYGFGGVIAYKNFDFNFFFQGVADTYRMVGGTAYLSLVVVQPYKEMLMPRTLPILTRQKILTHTHFGLVLLMDLI